MTKIFELAFVLIKWSRSAKKWLGWTGLAAARELNIKFNSTKWMRQPTTKPLNCHVNPITIAPLLWLDSSEIWICPIQSTWCNFQSNINVHNILNLKAIICLTQKSKPFKENWICYSDAHTAMVVSYSTVPWQWKLRNYQLLRSVRHSLFHLRRQNVNSSLF